MARDVCLRLVRMDSALIAFQKRWRNKKKLTFNAKTFSGSRRNIRDIVIVLSMSALRLNWGLVSASLQKKSGEVIAGS